MQRRHFLALAALPAALSAHSLFARRPVKASSEADTEFDRLVLPDERWKELLSEPAYYVLRKEGTERPGTSVLNREKRDGTYVCAGCFLPLFESSRKYDSGTGWPSFWAPIDGRLGTKKDYKLLRPRIEYHCVRCEGHQGHVFDDGPRPTGKRYCNNGVALQFVPKGEALPTLRT